jgi:outer membrane lipoprotein-sorting protein
VSARKRLSSTLAVAVLLAGCAIAVAPPREAIPDDVRRAIALLEARWREFEDFRTLADIVVEQRGHRQALTGALLARTPGSFRFEGLSPFGQPFLFLVVHDGTLTAYNAATNQATIAPATAQAAARLLSLPIEPENLVATVAGLAVPPRDLRSAELLEPDDHGPSLAMYGAVHQQRVWMDLATGVVNRVEIIGGRAAARVTYLRGEDGQLRGFDATAGEGLVVSTVRYRNPETNTGVPADRFPLTVPGTAQIEHVR